MASMIEAAERREVRFVVVRRVLVDVRDVEPPCAAAALAAVAGSGEDVRARDRAPAVAVGPIR